MLAAEPELVDPFDLRPVLTGDLQELDGFSFEFGVPIMPHFPDCLKKRWRRPDKTPSLIVPELVRYKLPRHLQVEFGDRIVDLLRVGKFVACCRFVGIEIRLPR